VTTTADIRHGAPSPLGTASGGAVKLERKGRRWLLWSFVFCPCHLPLTLGVLAVVLGGTGVGALVREHSWLAGGLVTTLWVLGTGYGFVLIRRAQRAGGACPVRQR
jgi:hypothetical protein